MNDHDEYMDKMRNVMNARDAREKFAIRCRDATDDQLIELYKKEDEASHAGNMHRVACYYIAEAEIKRRDLKAR